MKIEVRYLAAGLGAFLWRDFRALFGWLAPVFPREIRGMAVARVRLFPVDRKSCRPDHIS